MSKIYRALEKAEREREKEFKPDHPPVLGKEEEINDSIEAASDLSNIVKVISNQQLVSFSQPGSLAAEQFRKLRTHLMRLNIANPPKTIMITSSTDSEGKTLVATNLAAGIAHDLHAHALLMDCDMRNPALTRWFDLQNNHGLSDYLVGKARVSDLLRKTEMEKLSLMPSGSPQENPAELIGSNRMEALIHELKSRYRDRYIILDATPLLATTEPQLLARLVDGVIIVVRAGVTQRETVKQAIASLEKEKILGFVLNELQFKSSALSSRYFGSDGYYYHYGYGKAKTDSVNRWVKLFRSIRRSN